MYKVIDELYGVVAEFDNLIKAKEYAFKYQAIVKDENGDVVADYSEF